MIVTPLLKKYFSECLSYDPGSGVFTWLERPITHFRDDVTCRAKSRQEAWNRKYSGKRAGSVSGDGYEAINIRGKLYKTHRLAFLFMNEKMPEQVDHVDHDPTNNAWSNLRGSNNVLNHRNRPLQRNSKTGITGVSLCKRTGKYEAYITIRGLKKNLGRFNTLEKAKEARLSANVEYGFSKNHGIDLGERDIRVR